MAEIRNPGEEKAWELLVSRAPADICNAAAVAYDSARGVYQVKSFGFNFDISPAERTILSARPGGEVLTTRLENFFRLSILWYLVKARNIPASGRMIKLHEISGGDIFSKGSHVLPFASLQERYGRDREAFLLKGRVLGGSPEAVADSGFRFFPLPRVPVVLTLWLEDEEFPARVDMLFDSTCALQIPTDIIWSVAMMSVLVMT